MTERKPPGMSFETWVESQISRAQARGHFDDLAGAGKPLPRRTEGESTYAWVVDKARQENIDVRGMLPPALALRKEREDLPRRVVALTSEEAVRDLVGDFNERVELFWRRPQEGPGVPVGLADVETLVAVWRMGRVEPAVLPPPSARPAPRRLFRFFRRR